MFGDPRMVDRVIRLEVEIEVVLAELDIGKNGLLLQVNGRRFRSFLERAKSVQRLQQALVVGFQLRDFALKVAFCTNTP